MTGVHERWSRKQRLRRVLWVAAGAVIGLLVFGVLMLAGRVSRPSPPDRTPAFVAYPEEGADPATRGVLEMAVLADPAPLLLPTRWSAAVETRAEVMLPAPRAPFGLLDPVVGATAGALAPAARDAGSAPALLPGAADAGVLHRMGATGGIGAGVVLGPVMEVAAMDGSRAPLRREVPSGVLGDLGASGPLPPVEFLFWVADGGRLGFPLLISGSGVEAVDLALRQYLAGQAWMDTLPRGYYRVTIAP